MLQDSAQQTSSHIDHNGQPAFTYDSSSLCFIFCLLITHSAMFRTHLIRHWLLKLEKKIDKQCKTVFISYNWMEFIEYKIK